jgi:hypothetical protein
VEKLVVRSWSEGLLVDALQWGRMFWVQVQHRVKIVMTTDVSSLIRTSGGSSSETSLTSQYSIMSSSAGWDSNPFNGASPHLPTNGEICKHPYTITYNNESSVNNAALHANILRPSKSEHLGSTRF